MADRVNRTNKRSAGIALSSSSTRSSKATTLQSSTNRYNPTRSPIRTRSKTQEARRRANDSSNNILEASQRSIGCPQIAIVSNSQSTQIQSESIQVSPPKRSKKSNVTEKNSNLSQSLDWKGESSLIEEERSEVDETSVEAGCSSSLAPTHKKSQKGIRILENSIKIGKSSKRGSRPESASNEDNSSLNSKTIGNRIGSLNSKEARDPTTGSCASSRRRSSRLTSKLNTAASSSPTANFSSVSGTSSSTATGGSSSRHFLRDNKLTMEEDPNSKNSLPSTSISEPYAGATASLNIAQQSVSLAAAVENESDDNEMGRLQALLEARGVPPHVFGALAPRFQHLLHRSMGNNTTSKAHQLIQALQAQGDEGQQLQAVIEMCHLLLMGNEDTLAGFPAKQAVPALISLLQIEPNFDIMNHSCRALTYMMESLPRSSAVIVDAIPVFLEKLQFIQCMDVAEQSLTALEMLSRRHSKAILNARGVSACLSYLDFFTINAQRAALSITANCCQNLTREEFSLVQDSLPTLSSHLIKYQDKKCLESLCLAFSRLVESFFHYPKILQQITENSLLNNIQQLLLFSPPIISTATFVMVIRMLATMCASCPQLAVQLLKSNISDTIRYLLLGSGATSEEVELTSRSPQELYEITSLIGELMPKLPMDDVFSVDVYWNKQVTTIPSSTVWQWKDDRGLWHSYSALDSRILEAAHQASEDEISLSTIGRTYIIDFNSMQQINEDTGTSRPVQRLVNSNPDSISCGSEGKNIDARIECLKEEPQLATVFVKGLFGLLYEVYSSSAGPSVRHKCISALLRIIYYSSSELLKDILENHSVSSHIAAMLPSTDLRVVVGAIQMVYILMDKLPETFSIYFRREGVIHQMRKLIKSEIVENESVAHNPITSPNMNTSIKEPLAGPSNATYEQNLTSCYLDSDLSSLNSVTHLQSYPSCDVPPSFFNPNEHYTTTHSIQFWDNSNNGGAHSSYASSQSLNSISSTQPASTPLSSPGVVFVKSADNSIDIRTPQMRLADMSKRKRAAKKSNTCLTGSSSRKSRNPIDSNTSSMHQYKSYVPSTPNLSSNNSRVDYESVAAHMGSQILSSPYVSMPFFAYSTNPNGTSSINNNNNSNNNNSNVNNNNNTDGSTNTNSGNVLYPPSISLPPTTNNMNASGTARCRPSRLSSAAVKTSSFFANLHPARWRGKWNSGTPSIIGSGSCINSRGSMLISHSQDQIGAISDSSSPRSPNNNGNKEKIKTWIREQVKNFIEKHFGSEESCESNDHPAMSILNRMNNAIEILDKGNDLEALNEIKKVVIEGDISPFELIHCGLIKKLIGYLTDCTDGEEKRDKRIRRFLNVFIGSPVDNTSVITHDLEIDCAPLSCLVSKLNACVSQLEQFPVKVHDVIGTGNGSGNIRGTSALKFFNTHHLKCNLQRHRDCTNLKQWRSGPVKIDPLALVQAIERYLVIKGYGRSDEDENSDEDNSDDDVDDNMAAMMISQGQGRHKIQFLIDDNVLPYNMTVYQAIRQFSNISNLQSTNGQESDVDFEAPMGHANMWVHTHTIYYRQYTEPNDTTITGSNVNLAGSNNSLVSNVSRRSSKSGTSKNASPKKKDELWTEGKVPAPSCSVYRFLSATLPSQITINDASLEVINLLRIINALNRSWGWFYDISQAYNPAISQTEFVNSKLTAKANRQLQDPLVIMTGNLPNWLSQIAYVCPFLFPFETRHLLFYVTSFDRDRALQRLLDTTPGLNSSDSSERVTPRLDKRKKTVTRDDILKQAESVFQELGHSKSLLEIEYENEVGTGLGPTLEFYALVSKELQRADLEMWRGESLGCNKGDGAYVYNSEGLFPAPISKTAKIGSISKIKNRYKLLGKFMAKALYDSRMVDIPLSIPFYKWILGQESTLTAADMQFIDSNFARTLRDLDTIAQLKNKSDASPEELTLNGVSIEDLHLDFTLPGFPNFELRKGGKDITVTVDNVDQYVKLLCHWTMVEGVTKQMESFKDGFESVLQISQLQIFYPEELEQLFCGSSYYNWNVKNLIDCCNPDHGYTYDSRAIKFLFEVMSSFDSEEQRKFLQFITGSPRLPVGGLKSLSPPLTIVRKTFEPGENPDCFLPSVMTCVNYLKLPDYSSIEIMREKLRIAANEGQHSFHLS